MSIELGLHNLYKENRSKIFKMVISNNGTQDDACDILQEGVIVVWNKFSQKKLNDLNCSLGTYLYSVCKNMWLNELRKKGKSPLKLINDSISDQLPDHDEIENIIENEKKTILIEKGLNDLGETCRKLLKMFYHQKESMEKIATEIGLSNTNAAKTKKYKCIQQLKRKVA